MDLLLAISLIENNIRLKKTHRDYERVKRLAKTYKQLITGEDADELLKRFVRRETDEMFEQRKLLTQLITPSLCSGVMTAFYKVPRNKKITKRIDVKDDARRKAVEQMVKDFYGNSPDTNGLDLFLETRFTELSFTDPNAWIVTEFDSFDNTKEFPKPRPFEVSADEAVNFEVRNQVTQWLLVRNTQDVVQLKNGVSAIQYRTTEKTKRDDLVQTRIKPGFKFSLYTDTVQVVYQEVNKDFIEADGIPDGWELVALIDDKKKEVYYLRRVFDPEINHVPAVRIGYKRDLHTDSRTFVNPFQAAMPHLMKSVKTVSELDLTMTLHAFPQKLQYARRCKGTKEFACNGGKLMDKSTCQECKGSGWKIPTTAQDAITLPMPEDTESMIDLSKIIHYVAPPAELIKLQMEYVDMFEPKVHKAVFNSTVFVQDKVAATATEKELEYESVYDTLNPFATCSSAFYKFEVRTFMRLADINEGSVTHAYPSDHKLKTVNILIAELKEMNDSGAPSFVKESISNDLAELIYNEDLVGFKRNQVMRAFWPFPGKTQEEIDLLMATNYITDKTKILYANFGAIMADLERVMPGFVLLDYASQKTKVDERVGEIEKELSDAKTERLNESLAFEGGRFGGNPNKDKSEEK